MKHHIKLFYLFVFMVLTGCQTTWKCTTGKPSHGNVTKWSKYLDVTEAKPDEPIGTTQSQISNVSPSMAVAKMIQALESYEGKLDFRLSTVYQLADKDRSEGEKDIPAVTDVVVGGHYYYICPLDYPRGDYNLAAYEQTGKKIPGVAVADAEDETKPAWIRMADEDGKAYGITIYLGNQASIRDPNNVYGFLRNHGYITLVGGNRLSNPTMEFDEKWRPYWTVTYERDDGWGEYGEAYYPKELLIIDAQTKELKSYTLDNPNTKEDERSKEIPEWVDQIYSPQVIVDWINKWGFNVENYGKTSQLNEFRVDGGSLDQSMNAANSNLVFVAYITSTQPDNSVVGVMLIDPRTGKAKMHPTQGPDRAMAVKSAAVNVIRQATALYGYNVEDLTLHTIYGVLTWEGVLTKPAYNNLVRSSFCKDGCESARYGSLYAGTVLLRADYDLKPANVVYALNKHEAFTKYEEHLYLRRTTRVGSNVLKDEEVTGKVSSVQQIVLGGDTSFLVRLEDQDDKLWEVRIPYLGDPNTEAVLTLQAGQYAYMKYGDPQNRETYIVKEIYRKKDPATAPESEQKTAAQDEPAKPTSNEAVQAAPAPSAASK